ncbi:MAG: hypothetical protein RIC51_03440 [Erythrobacter sp.]|uniref:hypothetical protein n=1 Tax=Erythrobacter sp. TaxID=1042 RepID=UPI0032EEEF70
MARIWNRCGAAMVIGGLLAASPPALAEDSDKWSSTSGEGRCDLRHVTGEAENFAISLRKDGSYALDGRALASGDGEGLVGGEIRVLAEGGNVLLSGAAAALETQRERMGAHPVALFLAANQGGDSFTLVTEAGLTPVPLDGYAAPAKAFGECIRVLFLPPGQRPPVPLAFDGLRQLAAAAQRQRLLSEVIGFTLEVDEDGNPTDCSLDRDFRRRIVTIELCRPLLEHHRFAPARDAEGNAVSGTYSSRIDFRMWMKLDGYIKREERD